MKLTDRVYEDLLTVYLAGDASPDTRALVEQHARETPSFGARLAAARGLALPDAGDTRLPDGELAALKRTRQFILLRTVFLAAAIFFTVLPLSVAGGEGGVRFLIIGKHDGLTWAFWSVAAASWVACWIMHRSVRAAGI